MFIYRYCDTSPISMYGVALVSMIDKMIGLSCKRALWKRRYSAKETYNSIDPTNRSHPISSFLSKYLYAYLHIGIYGHSDIFRMYLAFYRNAYVSVCIFTYIYIQTLRYICYVSSLLSKCLSIYVCMCISTQIDLLYESNCLFLRLL